MNEGTLILYRDLLDGVSRGVILEQGYSFNDNDFTKVTLLIALENATETRGEVPDLKNWVNGMEVDQVNELKLHVEGFKGEGNWVVELVFVENELTRVIRKKSQIRGNCFTSLITNVEVFCL